MFRCLIVESCVYLCTHASVCVCLKEVDRNWITGCASFVKAGSSSEGGCGLGLQYRIVSHSTSTPSQYSNAAARLKHILYNSKACKRISTL